MLLNLDTFLPIFCEENSWDDQGSVSNIQVTFIIVIFALTQLIFAPFNSIIKNKLGAKNTIVAGFFTMTLSTYGIGIVSYIKDPTLFITIGIIMRFL